MKRIAILLMISLFACIGHINSQTWTNYTKADGFAGITVSSIAIDAQGNKWFGSYYGVSKFDDTTWTTYNTLNSRTLYGVEDIAIDKQGHIVIGAVSGVSEFDGTTWKTYIIEKDSIPCASTEISSIAIDTLNNKWYGTHGCGVIKLDGNTWSSYTWSNDLTVDSLPAPRCDEVWAIDIDAQGNIWYSCNACGLIAFTENIPAYLVKYDGTTWTKYTTSEYLYNAVTAIAIDAQGNKWIGTGGGVYKFDGNNWTIYNTLDGLVSNDVRAITIDSHGNKWIGTSQGVSKFDGTNWTTYLNPNGWEFDYILDIAIDEQGIKWFGTFGGVAKLCDTCTSPDTTTEITTVEYENHLDLHPNPVQNVLHINLPARTGAMQVLDMHGECIIKRQISENENNVDVSCLRDGIYFVRVFYDNQIFVRKIVKY